MKSRASKLHWTTGRLTEGPYAGRCWGAQLHAAFLMIVPAQPISGRFEIWFADIVLGDEATLPEAKGAAERLLRGYMDRLGNGIAALSTAPHAIARAA